MPYKVFSDLIDALISIEGFYIFVGSINPLLHIQYLTVLYFQSVFFVLSPEIFNSNMVVKQGIQSQPDQIVFGAF